jgi:LPS export ABC transporter protein LptC
MGKSVTAFIFAVALFACEGNKENIMKMNLKDDAPVAIGTHINLKYTDSGKLVANLIAPKLLDYSNLTFPYQEFPEGIELHFWDEGGKSTVTADYAIRYESTQMVDLREEVVVLTKDSIELQAEQLYWDQQNQWLFTDRPYHLKMEDGSFNDGERLDSSEDFKTFLSRKNDGIQIIEKNKANNGN